MPLGRSPVLRALDRRKRCSGTSVMVVPLWCCDRGGGILIENGVIIQYIGYAVNKLAASVLMLKK